MSELRIRPMTAAEFEPYRTRLIRDYAADNVRAGNWSSEEADALAAHEADALLPAGRDTPGMLMLTAENAETEVVGYAWLALEHPRHRGAWLYDIVVISAHRGRGYGRALLAAVEAEARRRGSESIGLNVFWANRVARELYQSADFDVASLQMRKRL
jgi:ribosomal protein S18 acetylase RimI-like enzyme